MGGVDDAESVTGITAAEISTEESTKSPNPSGEPTLTSNCPPAVPPSMTIM